MTKSIRGFFYQQSCNSKINDRFWTVFELVRDFIHFCINSKFQEYPIKTERVIMMTKSNRGFFQQLRGCNSKSNGRIWSVFDFPRFHPCPPYLQVSSRSNQSRTSYTDDKLKQRRFQQSWGYNSKINDPIWPVFELVQNLIHAHTICKFQGRTSDHK